ncbi:MAG: transcription elongation factor GreA [bacterium]|nr:transcription elongation factor GreA [bacterium]
MTQLTKEGLEILQKELKDLIEDKKPKAIDRLQKARNMGDLSENSEYTSAKESLAIFEDRIFEIQETLKTAEVVEDRHNNHEVSLGSNITVLSNGVENNYHIVGEYEADPSTNKLSITSPIGKALLGKKTGESVEVEVPDGTILYKIIKIN